MAKVAVEKEGTTTIVSIDRFAEARNAVDPETAILLREAFFAFDADDSQSVAILTGRGGTFCFKLCLHLCEKFGFLLSEVLILKRIAAIFKVNCHIR